MQDVRMKVRGFDALPNGNMFSEFYGELSPAQARFVRKFNLSPSDCEALALGHTTFMSDDVVAAWKALPY